MEETTQVIGGAEAGAASQPTTLAEGQQPPAEKPIEPKYVTEEVFEQKLQEAMRRMKQGDKDRMKAIDDKFTALKTRLEAGGSELTQQQANALREQIENDLSPEQQRMEEAGNGTAKPAPSELTPEMKRQADFVYAQLEETFADVGETVTPNDPEWKEIQDVLDNPKGSIAKLVRMAVKQAEAKAARKNNQTAGAAARVVSAGVAQKAGDALGADVTGHDLFQRARQ